MGECSFWYRPTRVVPDQRPLNGRCCCCCFYFWYFYFLVHVCFVLYLHWLCGKSTSSSFECACVLLSRCLFAAGSAEGFSQADKAINSATKSGRWVMLKNVHLAPQWLVQLEKKLHSLTPHANFRLFLTMEINPKVYTSLLPTYFD